jgi:ATP-dependent Zn protease
MDGSVKTALFWVLIIVSAFLLWRVVRAPQIARSPEITYSTFIAKARAGQIASVIVTGDQIEGEYRNGAGGFHLTGPSNAGIFLQVLQDKGVEIRFRDVPEANLPLQLIGTWAPLVLLGALWLWMIRQVGRRRPPGASGGNPGRWEG